MITFVKHAKIMRDNKTSQIDFHSYKEKSEYVSENGIKSVVYLMDCMEGMKQMPDNFACLALVDPPYGIGMGKGAGETRGNGKKKKGTIL